MKRLLILLTTTVIIAVIIITLTKKKPAESTIELEADSKNRSKESSKVIIPENIRKDIEGIDGMAQNEGLEPTFADFRKLIDNSDINGFRIALSNLSSTRYKGDFKVRFAELMPYLNNENKNIRYELAKRFLWMGFEKKKAAQILSAFVDDENEKPTVVKDPHALRGEYTIDLRKNAAEQLTIYRMTEAIEPMWRAYEQTKDRSYLQKLAVFKDKRAGKEIVELVSSGKAKYSLYHNICGVFKIQDAKEELEATFQTRLKHRPNVSQSQLVWSLYQITNKQEYYDYLIEREFYVENTFIDVPDVLQILEKTLRADDRSDPNAQGEQAFFSLLARKDGREIIENYLVDVFDKGIKYPVGGTDIYLTVASLNSEKVIAAAQRYQDKYTSGSWNHYSHYKGFPINGLIKDYAY